MCVLGASVDLYVVKKMGLNASLAGSSASCLGASVNLYVVKNRVQESTICRDLGIVFGTLCRLVRRKKVSARIDDLSRFGHRVWGPLSTCRRLRTGSKWCENRSFSNTVLEHCKGVDGSGRLPNDLKIVHFRTLFPTRTRGSCTRGPN